MAYDPVLAERIRTFLEGTEGLVEKKLFGGIGWTIGGHLAAGAHKDGRLMIRCSKQDFPIFMEEPGTGGIHRGKKPLTGWVLLEPDFVAEQGAFETWVARGKEYASSLPPK